LRSIEYGPTSAERRDDYFTSRGQWNLEEATRRALRSIERRGLITLGSYVFFREEINTGLSSVLGVSMDEIAWLAFYGLIVFLAVVTVVARWRWR
jgi:hypothetical protein